MIKLPPKLRKQKADSRLRCPGHLAFVRRHACCACGATQNIEAAHVRLGLPQGEQPGIGLKPGDNWVISLCEACHATQHRIGERTFQNIHKINMAELAQAFAAASTPLRRYHAKQRRSAA